MTFPLKVLLIIGTPMSIYITYLKFIDRGLLHAIFVVGGILVCCFGFFLATDKTATEELCTAVHFCNMSAVLKLKSFQGQMHSIAAPM